MRWTRLLLQRTTQQLEHNRQSKIRDSSYSVYFHLIASYQKANTRSISAIYDWLETVNLSNKRVNNVLGPLHQTFQKALYHDHIDANPMDRSCYRSIKNGNHCHSTKARFRRYLSSTKDKRSILSSFFLFRT